MGAVSAIRNEELVKIKDYIIAETGKRPKAWQIKEELAKSQIFLDESTIRGRFLEMGQPLSGAIGEPQTDPIFDITADQLKDKINAHAKKFGVSVTRKLMDKYGLDTNPGGMSQLSQETLNAFNDDIEGQLTGKVPKSTPKPVSKALEIIEKVFAIPDHLKPYIPQPNEFVGYIDRPIDDRLAMHYKTSRPGCWKYPLTQGKQGTGKTFSHMRYAFNNQLPFYLFCAHEDFKLHKLFGEKTIQNGNVVFKEGLLTQAIQHPGVILIDEVNYISNENSVDFHAFLQNRELFVKDADNGNGKIYRLHEDCKIGFAQNPKSAKYIGGNVKPSNFLGRCTYLTYPEFTKVDIKKAISARFPNLVQDDVNRFTEFYFGCTDAIEQAQIPVDISIRQLNNVIDLYNHGLPLKEAIEDGLTSIMEAASQPKSKEAFFRIAQAVFKELIDKTINDQVGAMK